MTAGSVTRTFRGALTVGALFLAVLLPREAAAQVDIYPGQNIQSVVDGYPAGTAFRLKAGVHRNQTIRPRNGDTYLGEPGTVMNGARQLTNWVQSGNYWYSPGQTQQGPRNGECQTASPRCSYPEQLFINRELLDSVETLGQVAPPNWSVRPGDWYFDYDADRIYIPYNPFGLTVETSVTLAAFEGTADNVTINGIRIEMYAGAGQQGAVNGKGRSGWIVINNEIAKNHGAGVTVGPRAQVRQNYIQNNGQIGIMGSGDDILIENNLIFHNNTAHFYPLWEAGGVKLTNTNNLVVRGNYSLSNDGMGLWTDENNINTLYENNTTNDNTWMGIVHEISYRAVIRNNTVLRNCFGYPYWIAAAGILVAASSDVEVYGNYLDGNAGGIGGMQQNRGTGAYGLHLLQNLWVHHNTIMNWAGWTGIAQDVGDTAVFTSRNNRFEHNTYKLNSKALPFTWMNQELDEFQWRAYGLDTTGQFSR
jgi:parallel beta-helix repeat protein